MEEKDEVSGGLTQEEKERAVAWIKERGGDKTIVCAVCHQTKWTLAEHVVAPTTYLGGKINLGGGSTYPMVMLWCNNCGHTLFLNAVIIGLFVPEKKPDTEKEPNVKEEANG